MPNNRSIRTPRLAILVSSDRRRGAEVFGEALGGGLRHRGWDVELFSLTSSDTGPRVGASPVSSLAPDELGRLDTAVVKSLRKRMTAFAPDVVLANGAATMQYAVAALRVMRGRPRLVYVSIGEPMYWIRSPRHRAVRTAILKGVDRVLSVSATTAAQLVDQLGVPPTKVRVAPTGVPARFFEVVPEPPAASLRVVFIGNLSQEKDPLAALDVIERVAASTPVTLRFLGGGPLREEIAYDAARRGIGEFVEVLGSVPDVLPHLAWADVLLLTSQTEGLPGVPLEAGAAGVASVVFAAGGSAETVDDGVTGFVVPPGDTDAAAWALTTLSGNPAMVRRLGDAAREFVRERFTLEAAVDRYIDLLDDEIGVRSS